MISLTEDETRWLRLKAQRLLPGFINVEKNATEVVQAVCGLQAQEANAAALGVRARSAGLFLADVERALVEERSLVRTWGPRGTLHLLAASDLGWLVKLLRPLFIKKNQRRYRELGLDEKILKRGVRLIRQVLSDRGPLTRKEIATHLDREGMPTKGQALIYLIQRTALDGYVCLGPDVGNQPAYALVEDWISSLTEPSGEAALAKLARRYLQAYAPASPVDLAYWSGLGMGDARRAWESISQDLVEVSAAGSKAWMMTGQLEEHGELMENRKERSPSLRLLPRYDTYLLGYANRALAVPSQYSKRINAGGGIVNAAVLVDGRARGTWRIEKKRDRLQILVEPFNELDPRVIPALEAEVSDIGRFYGAQAMLLLSTETD